MLLNSLEREFILLVIFYWLSFLANFLDQFPKFTAQKWW